MKTTVFLGAGASKPFGYPLTAEILPAIRRRLGVEAALFGGNDIEHAAEARLKLLLPAVLPGFYDEALELPMITDLLSLIDYSLAAGRTLIPGRPAAHLLELRTLLDWALLSVIEPDSKSALLTHPLLESFCNWLNAHGGASGEPIGVISTNYDIAVERKLFSPYTSHYAVGQVFDFGMRWRDPDIFGLYSPPLQPAYRFYKLHGSLNWLRCENCEHIYINTFGAISNLAFQERSVFNTCDCGHGPLSTVLVAPSMVRDVREPNLLGIWTHALEQLRTSQDWLIIGYSMPAEDIAIRSLLIRAYNGSGRTRPRIRIVQRDESRSTLSRYKQFFPDCEYLTGGLEGFLQTA
ncbi:hypothetical protein [Paludibaculum fermentans]|uniref:hypothetical protein n=1 Tax=Paludibaculum fermentans TaxID=1473598 RepID=UPI003EBAC95F